MFLVLFSCTQFSMFGLATLGANPANVSSHPKLVRVVVHHCMFTNSEKNVITFNFTSVSFVFYLTLYYTAVNGSYIVHLQNSC